MATTKTPLSVDDIIGEPEAPVVEPVAAPKVAVTPPRPVAPAPRTYRSGMPSDDVPMPDQSSAPYQRRYSNPNPVSYQNPNYQAPIANPVSSGSYQNRGQSFNGVVDNRVIPDAGVPTIFKEGVLDVMPDGYGYLRPKFSPSDEDVYISASQVKRFYLRPGDMVGGQVRAPKEKERYYGLLKVEKVNGEEVEKVENRPNFQNLTPVYPDVQIKMEIGKTPLSNRIIDLFSPIGRGQRGLVVAPPKAGKTFLLKDIAAGVTANAPDIHLMAVLVGERPEEVTDLARTIKGEVIASNFDEPPENQTRVAEIAVDRAKRLVEMGKDVVILLDSITRLARAYNLSIPSSGRTLSGGFDPAALYPPKRFFGAARNIEGGGSLTIIGTCLVETGSKMDDLIYEEFKGTGNMELHLNRTLADRRIFPAIDIQKSGTRQEQLLYATADYPKFLTIRKMVDMLGADERTELFIQQLGKTESNADFLKNLNKGSK